MIKNLITDLLNAIVVLIIVFLIMFSTGIFQREPIVKIVIELPELQVSEKLEVPVSQRI